MDKSAVVQSGLFYRVYLQTLVLAQQTRVILIILIDLTLKLDTSRITVDKPIRGHSNGADRLPLDTCVVPPYLRVVGVRHQGDAKLSLFRRNDSLCPE